MRIVGVTIPASWCLQYRDRTEPIFVWGKFHLLSLSLCLARGIGVTYPLIFISTSLRG